MIIHLLTQRFQLFLCHSLIPVASVIIRAALAGTTSPERLLIEMDLIVCNLTKQNTSCFAISDYKGCVFPVRRAAGGCVPHPKFIAIRHRLVRCIRINSIRLSCSCICNAVICACRICRNGGKCHLPRQNKRQKCCKNSLSFHLFLPPSPSMYLSVFRKILPLLTSVALFPRQISCTY